MSLNNEIPEPFLAGAVKAAENMRRLNRVLLAAHVNLDGDALGSLCAAGYILKLLDIESIIYSCTGIPDYLKFVELPVPVCRDLDNLPFEPQGAVYLDCSEPMRLGRELAEKYRNWPSINIDHHLGENSLGSLANYIQPKAAATAQLVAYVAMCLGLELKQQLAYSVALGLMTDTGGFCHGNTTAAVFTLCARIVNDGCDMTALREKLCNNWTEGKLRLWGELFRKTRIMDRGQIAICAVSLAELEKYHCQQDDLEGLVERFRRIKGVKISALIREEGEDKCKFSLRSQGDMDVRAIAFRLGGGGHQNAAGGLLHSPLREAEAALEAALVEGLEH